MVVVARVPGHIGVDTGDMVVRFGLSSKGKDFLAAALIALDNGVGHN